MRNTLHNSICHTLLFFAFLVCCLIPGKTVFATETEEPTTDIITKIIPPAAITTEEKRAIWIAYSDIATYLQDQPEATFRKNFSKMCDTAISNKINTLLVHVRPMGDAIYPSSYYPWSKYITSKKTGPAYDPLAVMVEIAHGKGLKIEAWINPYRISNQTKITKKTKKTAFYKGNKSCIISYKAGAEKCLALDPSKESARQLIINGVREIVTNYDVDGIHMDDYFYVSGMKNKLSAKKKKANVNKLVKGLYDTIKSINPNCEFGISPSGNADNARLQGADIDTWLSTEGYVDYVIPQIYWSDRYRLNGKMTKLYSNRAELWSELWTNKNVHLYVGLGLYRVKTKSSIDRGWSSSHKNLAKQYVTARELGYQGYALFTYRDLERNRAKKELRNLKNAVIKP